MTDLRHLPTGAEIRLCAAPQRLFVPLLRRGLPGALPCVQVGERVAAGELIGRRVHASGCDVPAPLGGRIEAVMERPALRAPWRSQPCVVVDCDPSAAEQPPFPAWPDWTQRTPQALRQRLRDSGAATLQRLANMPPADVLLLDASEPLDAAPRQGTLLRQRPQQVIDGARMLARALGATRIVLLTHAPVALVADQDIAIAELPAHWPRPGRRARETAALGAAASSQRIAHCPATAAHDAWRAVAQGRHASHRLIHVDGVPGAGLYEVALGTPISHLIEHAGGYPADARALLGGGLRDGLPLPHDDLPIDHDSRALTVLGGALPAANVESPCIRCGDCADACPEALRPWRLLEAVERHDIEALVAEALDDCVHCGACTSVCPSRIDLNARLAQGHEWLDEEVHQRLLADAARERHLARQARQLRVQEEQMAAQAVRKEAASASAVLAAIARAKARRENPDAAP
ncbi:MAG: 4Fe-4S dicluster domain-containing protein [Lysobacteraceae bacterium]